MSNSWQVVTWQKMGDSVYTRAQLLDIIVPRLTQLRVELSLGQVGVLLTDLGQHRVVGL